MQLLERFMKAARARLDGVGLPSNNETHDRALEGMNWATQLIVVYPLWLDQPPVRLLSSDAATRN